MAAGGTAARAGAATSLRSSCWSRAARAASNLRSLGPGEAGGWVPRSRGRYLARVWSAESSSSRSTRPPSAVTRPRPGSAEVRLGPGDTSFSSHLCRYIVYTEHSPCRGRWRSPEAGVARAAAAHRLHHARSHRHHAAHTGVEAVPAEIDILSIVNSGGRTIVDIYSGGRQYLWR